MQQHFLGQHCADVSEILKLVQTEGFTGVNIQIWNN
jgi:hypothetical protein